jgi:plasmid stabilization system protein ParE
LRRIVWTEEAVANLEAIADYISAFNLAAAGRVYLARGVQGWGLLSARSIPPVPAR